MGSSVKIKSNPLERRTTALLIALFILCAIGIALTKTHFDSTEARIGRFAVPPSDTQYLTFGYREIAADLLWIRVVQDFGYCESRDGEKTRTEYEDARVLKRDNDHVCRNNWVYQMLDRVTDLDPKFQIAFQAGGTMLSLLVNDPRGAQAIFAKGLRYFPNDWNMMYRAGYHQLYEMKNEVRAAQYFYGASKNGAPAWLAQLSARLYTKEGKAEIGKAILDDFAKNNPDMANSPHFKQLAEQVNSELATRETLRPRKNPVAIRKRINLRYDVRPKNFQRSR